MPEKLNYLHELLSVLTEQERTSLNSLDLRGNERALFDYFLASPDKKSPTKEEMSKTLSMSSAYLDKTSSVILRKCYSALVTGSSSEFWVFLRQKYLPRHIYHELHLRERELIRDGDEKALAKFYFEAFEILHTLTFQDFDPEEAQRFMNRYFELAPSATATEHLMIEGRLIRQRITNALAAGKIGTLIHLEADLAKLEGLIDDSVKPGAICQLYFAAAQFYKVVQIDTIRQRLYLEKSLAIFNEYPAEFTTEDIVLLHCKIADTYYQESEFQKAYDLYKNIFPTYSELLRTQYFFSSTYAQLSMLCKEYEATDRILNEFYGAILAKGEEKQVTAMGAISFAKRHLLDHKPDKAKHYIDLGYASNDKGLIVSFEIELRKLETIYFVQKNDPGFAEKLMDKNMKFLQSKGIKIKASPHGIFFKLLRAINDERAGSKKLSPVQEAHLVDQCAGFGAIYGRLLETVRNI